MRKGFDDDWIENYVLGTKSLKLSSFLEINLDRIHNKRGKSLKITQNTSCTCVVGSSGNNNVSKLLSLKCNQNNIFTFCWPLQFDFTAVFHESLLVNKIPRMPVLQKSYIVSGSVLNLFHVLLYLVQL